MIEKEIKILDIKKKKLEKKLKKHGATKTFEGTIHDVYYDFKGSETTIEMQKKIFRIRKKDNDYLYTIKNTLNSEQKDQNLVMKGEGEYPISCDKAFTSTLEKYGLSASREKIKKRTSYKIDDVVFDIDSYEGIPTLLEIEADDAEKIRYWIDKLGLFHKKVLLKGSRGLFRYYGKKYIYINN